MKHEILACMGVLLLFGCSNVEHEDLKDWMREESKGFKGKIPPLPEIKAFPAVAYDTEKLIAPFSNLKIVTSEAVADKSSPDRDRQRQPLESFPLEDLRVSGVIIDSKVPWAMIQPPPPNKPKHVTIGEFMGQNFGRITQITTDGVTVIETVKDTNGAWTDREVLKPVPRRGGK